MIRRGLLLLTLAITGPALADTLYLRQDGGPHAASGGKCATTTCCHGETDAAWTGSNGPACALRDNIALYNRILQGGFPAGSVAYYRRGHRFYGTYLMNNVSGSAGNYLTLSTYGPQGEMAILDGAGIVGTDDIDRDSTAGEEAFALSSGAVYTISVGNDNAYYNRVGAVSCNGVFGKYKATTAELGTPCDWTVVGTAPQVVHVFSADNDADGTIEAPTVEWSQVRIWNSPKAIADTVAVSYWRFNGLVFTHYTNHGYSQSNLATANLIFDHCLFLPGLKVRWNQADTDIFPTGLYQWNPSGYAGPISLVNTALVGNWRNFSSSGLSGWAFTWRNVILAGATTYGAFGDPNSNIDVDYSHLTTNGCGYSTSFFHDRCYGYKTYSTTTLKVGGEWYTHDYDSTAAHNISRLQPVDWTWTPPAEPIFVVGSDDLYYDDSTTAWFKDAAATYRASNLPNSVSLTGNPWAWHGPVHDNTGVRKVWQESSEIAIHGWSHSYTKSTTKDPIGNRVIQLDYTGAGTCTASVTDDTADGTSDHFKLSGDCGTYSWDITPDVDKPPADNAWLWQLIATIDAVPNMTVTKATFTDGTQPGNYYYSASMAVQSYDVATSAQWFLVDYDLFSHNEFCRSKSLLEREVPRIEVLYQQPQGNYAPFEGDDRVHACGFAVGRQGWILPATSGAGKVYANYYLGRWEAPYILRAVTSSSLAGNSYDYAWTEAGDFTNDASAKDGNFDTQCTVTPGVGEDKTSTFTFSGTDTYQSWTARVFATVTGSGSGYLLLEYSTNGGGTYSTLATVPYPTATVTPYDVALPASQLASNVRIRATCHTTSGAVTCGLQEVRLIAKMSAADHDRIGRRLAFFAGLNGINAEQYTHMTDGMTDDEVAQAYSRYCKHLTCMTAKQLVEWLRPRAIANKTAWFRADDQVWWYGVPPQTWTAPIPGPTYRDAGVAVAGVHDAAICVDLIGNPCTYGTAPDIGPVEWRPGL